LGSQLRAKVSMMMMMMMMTRPLQHGHGHGSARCGPWEFQTSAEVMSTVAALQVCSPTFDFSSEPKNLRKSATVGRLAELPVGPSRFCEGFGPWPHAPGHTNGVLPHDPNSSCAYPRDRKGESHADHTSISAGTATRFAAEMGAAAPTNSRASQTSFAGPPSASSAVARRSRA
jgi:hypothetical protein